MMKLFRSLRTPHKFIIRRKLKAVFSKLKRLTRREDRDPHQHEIEYIAYYFNDRISTLPDSILHHILSFLPTKEVVKTCILSTRWKNLWASAPNLSFDDGLMYARKVDDSHRLEVSSFTNFVENVLRLREASNIEKFSLSCFVCNNNASQIHSWVSYAIMHNVQELDLSLFAKDPPVLPESIFDSTSLVSLKIGMDCVIQLPSLVSLPCLKTLHLSSVRFLDKDFTEKLFSGCPFLEELVLLDFNLVNLNNIVISSSTVKRLTIHDRSFSKALDPPSDCKINFDAANVTYFEYMGRLPYEILLNNALSLDKVCVEIPTPHEVSRSRAVDLLKQLRNVVSLRVSNRIMESLIYEDNMVYSSPVFPNLSHLVLSMESGDYPFGGLMDMLYFCPILQSICVSEGFRHPLCLSQTESDPACLSTPICMSSCLKKVTFKNFHAHDSEIYFLKFILKYACVLERMDIWWSKTQLPDLKKQTQARTELETIKRISATCVITFS